jgi:glycoprotein endo-alpha-1,2-mannosidase
MLLAALLACAGLAAASDLSGVHAAYYLWYGNPRTDGKWQHWNHAILPHWAQHTRDRYPHTNVSFVPPEDIHAPYYPQEGCYSSADGALLRRHFTLMREYGIDTAIVSWWGRPGMPGSVPERSP